MRGKLCLWRGKWLYIHEVENVSTKGKNCRWRGGCAYERQLTKETLCPWKRPKKGKTCPRRRRCAREEKNVFPIEKICLWRGRCAHQGKMWPWKGKCGHEREDADVDGRFWCSGFALGCYFEIIHPSSTRIHVAEVSQLQRAMWAAITTAGQWRALLALFCAKSCQDFSLNELGCKGSLFELGCKCSFLKRLLSAIRETNKQFFKMLWICLMSLICILGRRSDKMDFEKFVHEIVLDLMFDRMEV